MVKEPTNKEMKIFYSSKIMDILDEVYKEKSRTYFTVEQSLAKLTVPELSALWCMLVTLN